jgi:hypothetical protein
MSIFNSTRKACISPTKRRRVIYNFNFLSFYSFLLNELLENLCLYFELLGDTFVDIHICRIRLLPFCEYYNRHVKLLFILNCLKDHNPEGLKYSCRHIAPSTYGLTDALNERG